MIISLFSNSFLLYYTYAFMIAFFWLFVGSGFYDLRCDENSLCCEITLSQQPKKKEGNKEESNQSPQDKIVERACALLNSGGGVLKIVISDHEKFPMTGTKNNFWQRLDKFWQTVEEGLANLVKPSTYGDVFDRCLVESEEILLFINAPQHLCTMRYNLCFAGDARTHEASFIQVVELLQNLGSCAKKSLKNVDCLNMLPKLPERLEYEEYFEYHESKQIQLKYFSGKGAILANHGQRQRVQKWICAFANTSGGVILLGITDYGEILGVDAGKEEQDNITRKVIGMIEHMTFPITPERKVHWDIEFIPVSGCDTLQDRVVVAIKVARTGGVFMKDPESYELSDHGAIKLIEFDQWKQRMLSGPKLQAELKGTENGLENSCSEGIGHWTSSGVTFVPSISAVQKYTDSVLAWQGEFPVLPNGFHEHMSKDVQDIILEIKKRSSDTKSRGLIAAFKSLRAKLGGSPCDDVICDLLVISIGLGGLHLYTVCKEGKEEECLHYSKEVARLLKTCLVRDGGCSVRFYISFHPSSISKEVESPLPNTQYPQGYDLKGRREDLNLVIKALVIVGLKIPLPLCRKFLTGTSLPTRELLQRIVRQHFSNWGLCL